MFNQESAFKLIDNYIIDNYNYYMKFQGQILVHGDIIERFIAYYKRVKALSGAHPQ